MRVRLRGINSKRKRLADGSFKTYWYAWKGGPRLDGEPGSPEFMAAYNAAVRTKIAMPTGILKSIIVRFEDSSEFGQLADRTKADYLKHLDIIEREFGTFPIEGLKNRRARGIFSDWKDRLA